MIIHQHNFQQQRIKMSDPMHLNLELPSIVNPEIKWQCGDVWMKKYANEELSLDETCKSTLTVNKFQEINEWKKSGEQKERKLNYLNQHSSTMIRTNSRCTSFLKQYKIHTQITLHQNIELLLLQISTAESHQAVVSLRFRISRSHGMAPKIIRECQEETSRTSFDSPCGSMRCTIWPMHWHWMLTSDPSEAIVSSTNMKNLGVPWCWYLRFRSQNY